MKKEYFSPEFELVKFQFEDVILVGTLSPLLSPTSGTSVKLPTKITSSN